MIPIELRINGFVPNEIAFQAIRSIIDPAMKYLGLSEQDVLRIIVADNEEYGASIKEFAPNEGYTNDGIYQGVGKSLPHFAAGNYGGSILVFHPAVIGAFAPNPDQPEGEIGAMQYCLFHELGHCVDHRKRPDQPLAKVRSNGSSQVLHCLQANAQQLLSEYAACFFSAPFLSASAFRYIAESASGNLNEYFDRLRTERAGYDAGSVELWVVRNAALEGFWRGLIEFAKLFAFIAGNNSIVENANVNLSWPGKSPAAATAMQEFARKLGDAWCSYPECADAFSLATRETWFTITEAEGYRFEVKGDDDYLWLC